jgi:hypothetical protein
MPVAGHRDQFGKLCSAKHRLRNRAFGKPLHLGFWQNAVRRTNIWRTTGHHTKAGNNIPNDHKLYQVVIKYTKWLQYIPTFTIPMRSKNIPKLGFLV